MLIKPDSPPPILRERRKPHTRNALLSAGMILSLLIAALIIVAAFGYVSLTRDLPSTQLLPALLNPPDGLLLQPTRITDRTGENVIHTFAPSNSPRRYIPLGDNNPQYLPKSLPTRSSQGATRTSGGTRATPSRVSAITRTASHPRTASRLRPAALRRTAQPPARPA
jgi:hypothetical protein